MKFKGNSGNYQNAYERHEELIKKLKELTEKVKYEALLKLASALGITPEDLLRILAGLQGIDKNLGKRIDFLWIVEFGTIRVKLPKPFLNLDIRVPEPPEIKIKMCSAFTRLTGLEDKNTIYEAINTRAAQTKIIELKNYNSKPLNQIASWLEDWAVTFFRKKDKAMRLVISKELSVSTHYGKEVPDAPRLEFELIDIETGEARYGFIYTKGKMIWSLGNLPLSEIVRMIKEIGGEWEQ